VVFVFSSAGHKFCQECVSRASSVAIGDGKTELHCLADCNSVFALSTLQHALSANTFSKWLSKIQLADIEKVLALISSLNRALQKLLNIFTISVREIKKCRSLVCASLSLSPSHAHSNIGRLLSLIFNPSTTSIIVMLPTQLAS